MSVTFPWPDKYLSLYANIHSLMGGNNNNLNRNKTNKQTKKRKQQQFTHIHTTSYLPSSFSISVNSVRMMSSTSLGVSWTSWMMVRFSHCFRSGSERSSGFSCGPFLYRVVLETINSPCRLPIKSRYHFGTRGEFFIHFFLS